LAEEEMKRIHGMIDDGFKTMGTAIFSTDLDGLSPVKQLIHMSQAYLDCSAYLLKAVQDDHLSPTFSHVRATSFLFEHSLELFFKAGILAQRKEIDDTHQLSLLYEDFCKIYPQASSSFRSDIRSLTEEDPRRPYGQYSKYPFDKKGTPWPVNSHVILEKALRQIGDLRDDFKRLTPMIEAAESS
jgi:hypothetical protein